MDEILTFATVILPVVTAVVEAVKRGFRLESRYAPLLSLALGIAIGASAFPLTGLGTAERLWAGGLAGLGAMGLYDIALRRTSRFAGKTSAPREKRHI